VREFTKSAVILGTILSVFLGISNAYLKRGTILEANILQTIASEREFLAAVAFTLPAFFILSINIHPYSLGLLVLMGEVWE
jgi:uncharacterized oligopeptide transporter (OPT) family protein